MATNLLQTLLRRDMVERIARMNEMIWE